jgi:O-methyltransferase
LGAVMNIIRKIVRGFVPYGLIEYRRNIIQKRLGTRWVYTYLAMPSLGKERQDFVFEYHDYIRASSLELIANEIYDKNIGGSTAELGVYKGGFAKNINLAFPDRKLYLFDTFEGFDKRDIKTELENSYSTGEQDFSETSAEQVLKQMKNKQNCIIKKGIFLKQRKG